MKRIYNRNIPAPLPPHRMLQRAAPPVTYADLSMFCGPMNDQLNEGCCTGEAGVNDGEWIVRKYLPGLGPLVFSPQYTYIKELQAQGTFPNDTGSDGNTLCETMIAKGLCRLDVFPFVPGKIIAPTLEQETNASYHKIVGAYHGLVGSQTALSVLVDLTPWPILMGFTVLRSFESDETASTGIYNPKPGETVMGGHEMLVVGFDVNPTPIIRPKNCPPAVKAQNSWGPDWGLGGFVWLALGVVDDKDTDLKVAHYGAPWK